MEEVKEEEVKTVLEESKENKKDKSIKRIIFLIIGVIGIIGTIILFYLFNCTITPDKLLNEMKKSELIKEGIIAYETDMEKKELYIFENGSVKAIRKEFYDKRIENYKDMPCYIDIFENEQYAKLAAEYYEKYFEMQDKIAEEENYKLVGEGYSVYVNKVAVMILANNVDKSINDEYIYKFNNIPKNKYLYLSTKTLDSDEYENLERSIDLKIEKDKEIYREDLRRTFDEWIGIMEENLQKISENQNENDIKVVKEMIKTNKFEEINYLKEKAIDWNNRIAEIENQIKQKKEAVANNINERLNNIYITLNEEELKALKKEIEQITDNYYEGYKADWNTKITEIEKKIEEKSAEVYKNACKTYSYKEVARNPENYKGKFAYFKGKVVQVMESNYMTTLRVNVTVGKYGYYEDTIYVEYYNIHSGRILEDDIVNIYGMLDGLETYTTIMGGSVTIPRISAMYIEIE